MEVIPPPPCPRPTVALYAVVFGVSDVVVASFLVSFMVIFLAAADTSVVTFLFAHVVSVPVIEAFPPAAPYMVVAASVGHPSRGRGAFCRLSSLSHHLFPDTVGSLVRLCLHCCFCCCCCCCARLWRPVLPGERLRHVPRGTTQPIIWTPAFHHYQHSLLST